MAEFWYRLVTPRKRHCLAKLTLYVHICHVCDGLYARWRVKATLRYHFKTLDQKPRPRSQSYIGPTTVGPDKWDSFHENGRSFIIITSFKIALHLNRNNFRTIKAINFLFSTLHTTPFLYGKIHFGVLHLFRVRIAMSDTPPGSNST